MTINHEHSQTSAYPGVLISADPSKIVAGHHPAELRFTSEGSLVRTQLRPRILLCGTIFRFSNVHLGSRRGSPDAIGFPALPEWRFHKPISELTSSGLRSCLRRRRAWHGATEHVGFSDAAEVRPRDDASDRDVDEDTIGVVLAQHRFHTGPRRSSPRYRSACGQSGRVAPATASSQPSHCLARGRTGCRSRIRARACGTRLRLAGHAGSARASC